jgi:hypothetical protein
MTGEPQAKHWMGIVAMFAVLAVAALYFVSSRYDRQILAFQKQADQAQAHRAAMEAAAAGAKAMAEKAAAERLSAEKAAAEARAMVRRLTAERAAAEKAAAEVRAELEKLAAQRAAAARAAAEARARAEELWAKAEELRVRAEAKRDAAERAAAEARKSAERSAAASAPVGADALYEQAAALEQDGKGADAVRTYVRAARAGSGKAAKRLGEIYDKGIPGVERDYAESLKWYNAARVLGEDVPMMRR